MISSAGPVLDYRHFPDWIASSQKIYTLHEAGASLWRREDLVDIEQQLECSETTEIFTLRRVDGSVISVKNPMFGVEKPLWQPFVRFREYWSLVRSRPKDLPLELYGCSYFLEWENMSIEAYRGPHPDCEAWFEACLKNWQASATCRLLEALLANILPPANSARSVTKVLCFGLGNLTHRPPDWWYIQNRERPEHEQETEFDCAAGAFTHHAIALTLRDAAAAAASTPVSEMRLVTQDPKYTSEAIYMMTRKAPDFEFVGIHGAGGFAELSSDCIVFAPFVAAPINQIIADIARPAVIITCKVEDGVVMTTKQVPCGNPESPRSKEMWKEYAVQDFPLVKEEKDKLKSGLPQLKVYMRKAA